MKPKNTARTSEAIDREVLRLVNTDRSKANQIRSIEKLSLRALEYYQDVARTNLGVAE